MYNKGEQSAYPYFFGESLDKIDIKKIKYKQMTPDDFIISIDRLSRFKLPEIKYPRVYKEIISKHLIFPQLSLKNFDTTESDIIVKLVETIWNGSINEYLNPQKNYLSLSAISMLDNYYFKNIPVETKKLMKANLDISTPMSKYTKKLPQNVELLKEIYSANKNISIDIAKNIRAKYSTKFPIEKIILAEGITEEILLPVFAKKLGFDFEKNGVLVVGAGGKSKIPPLYSKLKDKVNLPIVIIMDNDAFPIYNDLTRKTSKKDQVIIINKGEFEDILPKNLLKRSFNSYFYDIEKVSSNDFQDEYSMCQNISNIYKSRQIGEFQKAHFAKIIAGCIKYKTDISPEIEKIILEIKST